MSINHVPYLSLVTNPEKQSLHPGTTRFDNLLNEQWLFVQPAVKPGCTTSLTNTVWQPCWTNIGCSFNTVVKPVVQPGLTTSLTTALNEQPLFVQQVVKAGCTTGLTTCCIHDTAVCQTGCQTGLTTGWMFVYTTQPFVNPVRQRVWQPVVSCIQTFTRLSNRFDNRLYYVNGALHSNYHHHHNHNHLWPFFCDHPGELVLEENF